MHLNKFPIYLEILSILLLQKGGTAGHSRPVEAVWLKLVNGKLKTEELQKYNHKKVGKNKSKFCTNKDDIQHSLWLYSARPSKDWTERLSAQGSMASKVSLYTESLPAPASVPAPISAPAFLTALAHASEHFLEPIHGIPMIQVLVASLS